MNFKTRGYLTVLALLLCSATSAQAGDVKPDLSQDTEMAGPALKLPVNAPAVSTSRFEDQIYDFMVPKVCVDDAGIVTKQNPFSTYVAENIGRCFHKRNILPGEKPNYFHAYFLGNVKYTDGLGRTITQHNVLPYRYYVFPMAKTVNGKLQTVDATDQTGRKSTIVTGIYHYADAAGVWHQSIMPQDGLSFLTARDGAGSFIGNLKNAAATDGTKVWGTNIGENFYLKMTAQSGDPAAQNAGVLLHNMAWMMPEVPFPGARFMGRQVYKIPAADMPASYSVVHGKSVTPLPLDASGQPYFPGADYRHSATAINFLKHLSRFTFGEPAGNDHPAKTSNLQTLVTFGGDRSLPTGDGPGYDIAQDANGHPIKINVAGSEHVYFSKYLGFNTRWEDWHRFNPHSNVVAAQLGEVAAQFYDTQPRRAATAYAKQNCTAPPDLASGGIVISKNDFIRANGVIVNDDPLGPDNKPYPDVGQVPNAQIMEKVTDHFYMSPVLTLSLPVNMVDKQPSGMTPVINMPYYATIYYTYEFMPRLNRSTWVSNTWYMVGCHDNSDMHDYSEMVSPSGHAINRLDTSNAAKLTTDGFIKMMQGQ